MGRRMQPRNEKFFTLFSKAGSNVVETAAILVSFLIIGFGDHAADPAGSQVGADRARGGGLVGQNTVGPGARSPEPSPDAQAGEQWLHHRSIAGLARGEQDDSGRPRPSTAAWIFVLSPPRDLPRA
jgi:hypothetical protein